MGLLDALIAQAAQEMAWLAGRVASGAMSPASWYREMQNVLAHNWYASYKAGLGRAATPAKVKWLEREYNKHNVFLRGFRDDIASGNLSETQIQQRVSMYADRLRGLYEAGKVASHDIKLPQVPGDGKTRCHTNCRCRLDFEDELDDEGGLTAVNVTWVYNDDEGLCPDCQKLGNEWNPLRVEVK